MGNAGIASPYRYGSDDGDCRRVHPLGDVRSCEGGPNDHAAALVDDDPAVPVYCRRESSHPRISSTPRRSSQGSWPASSRSLTITSRCEHGVRIEISCTAGGACTRRRPSQRLRWAQQRLGRHARVVGTLATDQLGLDDRHRATLLGQSPGEHLARGPVPITIT